MKADIKNNYKIIIQYKIGIYYKLIINWNLLSQWKYKKLMKLLTILNYHSKITSVQEITIKFMATNIPQYREGTVSVN